MTLYFLKSQAEYVWANHIIEIEVNAAIDSADPRFASRLIVGSASSTKCNAGGLFKHRSGASRTVQFGVNSTVLVDLFKILTCRVRKTQPTWVANPIPIYGISH